MWVGTVGPGGLFQEWWERLKRGLRPEAQSLARSSSLGTRAQSSAASG